MGTAANRLKRARHRRLLIAAYLNALKTGTLTLEHVLDDPPVCLGRVRIHVVIEATKGIGVIGTKKCLEKAHVWPTDTLDQLTPEQREKIKRYLPPRARYHATG